MKTAGAFGLAGGLAAVAILLYSCYSTSSEDNQLFQSKMLEEDEMAYLGWLNEYGKSYVTKEEYRFRLEQFKRTWKQIEEHDEEYYGIKVGFNEHSDKTEEEWQQMKGYIPTSELGMKAPKHEEEVFAESKPLTEPENVELTTAIWDWRTRGIVTPVKAQGRCGSCWAFSAVAAMESSYAQVHGFLRTFSEQQIVDCVRRGVNGNRCCNGCVGGGIWPPWQWLRDNGQGVVPEVQQPYRGIDTQRCQRTGQSFTHGYVQSYSGVARNAQSMRQRLNHRVIAVAIEAENSWFRNYRGGIIRRGCGQNLDHAVVAVGWGNENGQPYFIVKNSWGPTWGERGYVRIAPNQCGITLDVWSVNMQRSM